MLAPIRTRKIVAYGVTAIAIVIACGLRFLSDPVLEDHASFSFFFVAVSLAAWMGGIWPALFAAILGTLAGNYFFTAPLGSLRISGFEEFCSMLIFIVVSLIIGLLSETSLRAMEQMKVLEQAKDNFMTVVAHELRNPLTVIHYANSLDRISTDESARDHIELIDRQVHHLNVMIQDLLDASRVARGTIRLTRQHVDAAAIIEGAIEKSRPVIERRRHQLHVDVALGPLPLHGDALRLEQVLSNLLTNAAKYTPEGGEIRFSAHRDGDHVVFTVRDNGLGIATEMLPHVFDMFMQAEAASRSSDGGLGIGLALVRKLVEMHGGSVSATSGGRNRGSQFVVRLPLAMPEPATLANAGHRA